MRLFAECFSYWIYSIVDSNFSWCESLSTITWFLRSLHHMGVLVSTSPVSLSTCRTCSSSFLVLSSLCRLRLSILSFCCSLSVSLFSLWLSVAQISLGFNRCICSTAADCLLCFILVVDLSDFLVLLFPVV